MTISSLTASLAASTAATATTTAKTSTDATADTSPVTRAMSKVDARLQDQLDTATTQLSSFGKLKASVSDAQLAARALGGLATPSNAADMKAAANNFVTAFNAALATAKATAQAAAQGSASSAEASGARHVGSDLGRSIGASAAMIDSLRKLGIKQAADGSLSMDAAKFDAAGQADPTGMRSVLAGVGQAVDRTATAGLATTGQVGASITSLSQRFSTLVSHRKALLKMEQNFSTSASDSSSSSATSSVTGNVNAALAAYLQNR
jgi:hypothetical protein